MGEHHDFNMDYISLNEYITCFVPLKGLLYFAQRNILFRGRLKKNRISKISHRILQNNFYVIQNQMLCSVTSHGKIGQDNL